MTYRLQTPTLFAQEYSFANAKPFLKWAGGKTQLLNELAKYIPKTYNTYIEPFLGGGALFFFLKPKNAILSDINPELINCYSIVRDNLDELIKILNTYKNDEAFYYKIRSANLKKLTEVQRAARFIFLNKTCYNGLYRENRKGEFNVPFGKYKKVKFYDEESLYEANRLLQNAKIVCKDYKIILKENVNTGDLVFLDPPYHPIGGYSDFNRYSKEPFSDDDHLELKNEVDRLVKMKVDVISTNSNTKFINEIYKSYNKKIIDTKRFINSKANGRNGQDLIIYADKKSLIVNDKDELLKKFPGTRYMGSKYKILPFLWDSIKDLNFVSVLDAFSGSGCVSYMLKQKGKEVYSNDFMAFTSNFAKALIENSSSKLDSEDVKLLLKTNKNANNFISSTFHEIYFEEQDNLFLDNLRANIDLLVNPLKKSIALAAISRACLKKRARGIFTYVGNRYNDGRRDLQLSLREHFLENIESFNQAVFDNGKKNKSFNSDIFELDIDVDLVYFDPPYLTSRSDNDYIRRYHFVEGLVKNWKGLNIEQDTKTKKFKKYPSPFDSKHTVNNALDTLFKNYKNSIIIVSYSSNSIPTKKEMLALLSKYKKKVELKEIDYQYSFGNQNHKVGDNANKVKEYLFIAR